MAEIEKIKLAGTTYDLVDNAGRYEANLRWGGRNIESSFGPIDAAMVPDLGANRLAFFQNIATTCAVEYSTNGGSTWVDYGASASQKSDFFNGNGCGFTCGKATSSRPATTQDQLRVTLLLNPGGLYTVLNKFVMLVSTEGSTNCWCTIRARTQSNYESDTNTWVTFADKVPVSGWSGWNVININNMTTWGGADNTKGTQYGQLQFIFGLDGSTVSGNAGFQASRILGFGGVGWRTPSNMAKNGHLYSYHYDQTATFPTAVEAPTLNATSTLKVGGSTITFKNLTITDGSTTTTYQVACKS